MKRTLLTLTISLVFWTLIEAQNFSNELIFADSFEYKDTLTFGFDINTVSSIELKFAENNFISEPLSNNFEVRKFTKRLETKTEYIAIGTMDNNKIETEGIYISSVGVEVHQMFFYHHFIEFEPNGTFTLKWTTFTPDNPIVLKYSQLVEQAVLIGKGKYFTTENKVYAEIENHTVFNGIINENEIYFVIKSKDYYLFNSNYTFLKHD